MKRTKQPRTKRVVHEWWTAVLRGERLSPSRGCVRKVVELGDGWSNESVGNENHRSLTANLGDKLMLFGSDINEIQIVEVTSIKLEGYRATFAVRRGTGAVNDGPVRVHKVKLGAA